MLDENTKLTLKNAIVVALFFAGLVYGYAVIIGGITNRLSILEAANADKGAALERIEGKIDKLIERELAKGEKR